MRQVGHKPQPQKTIVNHRLPAWAGADNKYLPGGACRGKERKMNRFKYQAYVQEFPFLQDIIGDEIPDSVRVKRADENLLKVIPKYYYHNGSMGVSKLSAKVHFVLQDGSILHDAVKQSGHTSSNYAHSQTKEWEGETVLEAIDRHGVADQLQYIVQDVFDLDDWEGQEYHCSWEMVIYKTPKGTSFGAEIEKARAQALAEVCTEADF
jgi:hypothetical protein